MVSDIASVGWEVSAFRIRGFLGCCVAAFKVSDPQASRAAVGDVSTVLAVGRSADAELDLEMERGTVRLVARAGLLLSSALSPLESPGFGNKDRSRKRRKIAGRRANVSGPVALRWEPEVMASYGRPGPG